MSASNAQAPFFAIDLGAQRSPDDGHLGDGWSAPEGTRRWTIGLNSALYIPPLSPFIGDATLEFVVSPFVSEPRILSQRLIVSVNDEEIKRFVVSGETRLVCQVPARLINPNAPTVVVFEHPDAARPSDLGLSSDNRTLAIAFKKLSFYPNRPPCSPVPLPPPLLRQRVAGTADEYWFVQSGARTVDEWMRALAAVQIALPLAEVVLDFGCGCGRTLRHLKVNLSPAQRLIGADVDKEAIDWLRANFPGIETVQLDPTPPAEISSSSVDLIVSHSVFTHLPEDVQFEWLFELHRILKPGGSLVTSVHGAKAMNGSYKTLLLSDKERAEALVERFRSRGFFYEKGRNASEEALPDYYGGTFHSIRYIEDRWLPGKFELKAYLPGGALALQDIVIVRRIAE